MKKLTIAFFLIITSLFLNAQIESNQNFILTVGDARLVLSTEGKISLLNEFFFKDGSLGFFVDTKGDFKIICDKVICNSEGEAYGLMAENSDSESENFFLLIKSRVIKIGNTSVIFDVFNKLSSVGNTSVSYDREKKLSRIGRTYFYYNNKGKIRNVGNTEIYNQSGGTSSFWIGKSYISFGFQKMVEKAGPVSIDYDMSGKIKRIGNTRISYLYDDRLKKVGDNEISYDMNKKVTQIGNMKIGYEKWKYVTDIGKTKIEYSLTDNRVSKIGNSVIYYVL